MYYTEFFKLCGFEEEEIERERPRIDKTFERLGIGDGDIRRAESRVRENFDIELQGVRKLLGIWMKELLALVLAREENKKVVYYDWPLPGATMMAVARASDDVYVGSFGQVFNIAMGSILDKLSPILEAGEETGLTPGSAHCGLWQTHVGAIVKGLVPIPDLIVSSGWYCDEPAEADELLHEVYGIPVVYIDGCLDSGKGQWPEHIERRIQYSGGQITKALKAFEEVTGREITEEAQHAGRRDNARLMLNFQNLVELVGKSDPQPISQADLGLIYWMTNTVIRDREGASEALNILLKEVKQRVDEEKGVVEKGAPRVFYSLRQPTDPTVLKMIEGLGLALPVVFADWLVPFERTKAQSTDFGEKVMEGYYKRGLICSTSSGIEFWKEYCKAWDVDGAILCYIYNCRPMCIWPLMAKKVIKEELGIPVLALEGDCYDTRNYSAGQLRTRIETFADMLRAIKVAKQAGSL